VELQCVVVSDGDVNTLIADDKFDVRMSALGPPTLDELPFFPCCPAMELMDLLVPELKLNMQEFKRITKCFTDLECLPGLVSSKKVVPRPRFAKARLMCHGDADALILCDTNQQSLQRLDKQISLFPVVPKYV